MLLRPIARAACHARAHHARAHHARAHHAQARGALAAVLAGLARLVVVAVLAACASGPPRLELETSSFDFGAVSNGQVVSRTLALRNTGSGALVIESVDPTCGCTQVVLDRTVIPPGEQAALTIRFDSGAFGPYVNGPTFRRVVLATNDPQARELRIEFTANVLPSTAQPTPGAGP